MGSTATSPKLGGETEVDKKLNAAASLEISPTKETAQPVSPKNDAVISDEVNRVERLLTQLEARSTALVPYGFYNQPPQAQATKSNKWLIAAALGCIWLSTLALAIAYFSYRHSLPAAERNMAATPLVIPALPDPQNQKTAESVEHLSNVLVTSSERLNKVETALEKSNYDLQQLKARMNAERAKVAPIPPKVGSAQRTAAVAAVAGNPVTAPVFTPSPNLIPTPPANPVTIPAADIIPSPPAKASPEVPYRVLPIKPTDAAIPHWADGAIDYWLVARGAFKELAKVVSIGSTPDGVVVHNLADGKNYLLTPQGEWRNAEW